MGADVKIIAGCSKRLSSKAAVDGSTGGVAPGYVEDAFEGRTTLADFFSILLPFPELNRQRLPGKDAIQIGMAVRGGRDEFDGFVQADRRAAAG